MLGALTVILHLDVIGLLAIGIAVAVTLVVVTRLTIVLDLYIIASVAVGVAVLLVDIWSDALGLGLVAVVGGHRIGMQGRFESEKV